MNYCNEQIIKSEFRLYVSKEKRNEHDELEAKI